MSNNTSSLHEVRDIKSGRHLDFINAPSKEAAQAVFDYKYVRDDRPLTVELHHCNVKSRPSKDGKPYIF